MFGIISHHCRLSGSTNAFVEFDLLRGHHVDKGRDFSPSPTDGANFHGECASCVTAGRAIDRRTQGVADYVDDDVVVISGPGTEGWVVVPRRHVTVLEELPVLRRANVLAALRRAAQSVRVRNPGSAARVVAITDLPTSEGHVCFHVSPSDSDNSMD